MGPRGQRHAERRPGQRHHDRRRGRGCLRLEWRPRPGDGFRPRRRRDRPVGLCPVRQLGGYPRRGGAGRRQRGDPGRRRPAGDRKHPDEPA
ncbi:hypothetical protein NBE95_19240 (plasmid) [Paracoccus sp. TOH]|nr:hypothetical protein NBE95_19240 [Paracoccus sp. TOH]